LKSVQQIAYPCTQIFYFTGELIHAGFFIKMGDKQSLLAQAGFIKKITHSLGALVRPQISFKVSAFTLAARYQNDTVGTGFKRLE
jgi:hypothetical protein